MLPSPLFDLPALSRFFFTAVLLFAGAFFILRRAASRFFFVGDDPASFVPEETRRSTMAVASGPCAACGGPGTKKCSRCKSVLYCSQACQAKHWGADHKQKCKQIAPLNDVSPISAMHKRKSSGISSLSLVPSRGTCKVLPESKKILFPYDEFVKLFDWDKPGFPPCGLLNCGNSCFANVVLQCLACTRPLTAYLLEKDHSRACIRKRDDWCFLCELQIHIQRASESLHPFSPLNILSRLPNIGGNLGCGRQEDAHEFMRFAIDTMQSICLDEFGGEKALDMSSQETTLIQHIFGGQLLSQVICTKCNIISNRYENMMDLTVEIQGDAEYLEECLDQFTAEEWLDGDNKYKCDGCNDYVKACKRLTVHRAPNILTITLKRFQSGRFGKLNKRVAFPENLDLTPYMSGNRDGTDVYTLYAVVVHVDMLNASFFGHYICYTKGSCGRWYRIDDCKVMNVDVDEVLSQGAYMLLYRRKIVRPEALAKPLEEPMKRNSAEVDPMSSRISKGADDVHELTDIGSQPSMPSHAITCEASLLDDTGYETVLPAKIDNGDVEERVGVAVNVLIKDNKQSVNKGTTAIHTDNLISRLSGLEVNKTKVDELESTDLHVSIKDQKQLAHEDTPNLQIDYSNPSWSGLENLEEKKDALHSKFIESDSVSLVKVSFTSVQAMDFQEHCGITDATCHKKYNGSIDFLDKSTSDSSFYSHNTNPETTKTSGTCSSTSVTVQQLLYDSIPKRTQVEVGILLPNSKDPTEVKTLLPYVENGSSRKPKPMFANGFLDRVNKRNSKVLDSRVKVGNSGTAVAHKVTDCSQQDSVVNMAQQSKHDDCIGLPSLSAIDNGTISRFDLPCSSKVSLTASHEKPLDKDKILTEDVVCNGHPCKADYITQPDMISPSLMDNIVRNQPEKSCEELADINLETEEKLSGEGFHICDLSRKSFPENGSATFAKSDVSIPGSFLPMHLYKKPLNKVEICRKDSDEACYSCSSDYNGYAEDDLHQNGNGGSGLDTSRLNGLSAQYCFFEDLHEHKSQELGCKTEIETKETGDAALAYGTGLMSENYSNNP